MVVRRTDRGFRAKILNGILRFEKRPISCRPLKKCGQIEASRANLPRRSSGAIGEMVMDHLRELDDVAYVRFASVYRQFKDLDRFIEEVQQLRKADRYVGEN